MISLLNAAIDVDVVDLSCRFNSTALYPLCPGVCFTEHSFSEIHTVGVKRHDRASNYWLRTSDSLICSSRTCLQPIRKINSLSSRRTTANSSTDIWRYMFLHEVKKERIANIVSCNVFIMFSDGLNCLFVFFFSCQSLFFCKSAKWLSVNAR